MKRKAAEKSCPPPLLARRQQCCIEDEQGIMDKPVGSKSMGLLKSVEERALSKKMEDEQEQQQAPYFHKDCMSNILIWLPLESLQSSRFVCKPWYNIINSRSFINAHFHRSESVLIFLKLVTTHELMEQQNIFSVETVLLQSNWNCVPIFSSLNSKAKFLIQFMEFKEGKIKVGKYDISCHGKIRATCNGLILLDNEVKEGLIVMNPVTRKLITLPLGTICRPSKESYGFVWNQVTGEYKVVHLFRDELEYLTCETLNVATRSWRAVDAPSFGAFNGFAHSPVSAIGALHWLPRHNNSDYIVVDAPSFGAFNGFAHSPVSAIGALHWLPRHNNSDYIVSMEVENEKFHHVPLPKTCRTHDNIIEMGELLCFITHEDLNIDIWNLKSVHEGIWTKQHTIVKGCILDMVPVFSLRIGGDLIFRRKEGGSFHAYDFKSQTMREFERDNKEIIPLYGSYLLPHVNSLISWTQSRYLLDD